MLPSKCNSKPCSRICMGLRNETGCHPLVTKYSPHYFSKWSTWLWERSDWRWQFCTTWKPSASSPQSQISPKHEKCQNGTCSIGLQVFSTSSYRELPAVSCLMIRNKPATRRFPWVDDHGQIWVDHVVIRDNGASCRIISRCYVKLHSIEVQKREMSTCTRWKLMI